MESGRNITPRDFTEWKLNEIEKELDQKMIRQRNLAKKGTA